MLCQGLATLLLINYIFFSVVLWFLPCFFDSKSFLTLGTLVCCLNILYMRSCMRLTSFPLSFTHGISFVSHHHIVCLCSFQFVSQASSPSICRVLYQTHCLLMVKSSACPLLCINEGEFSSPPFPS